MMRGLRPGGAVCGMRKLLVPAAAALALLATVSGWAKEEGAAGAKFVPKHAGVLTVATAFLPAPGFWQGNPPTSGFEAGLARELAHRLGLGRVEVVQVPFGRITRGDLGRADIALSQVTPTKEREKSADFTTPYLIAPP